MKIQNYLLDTELNDADTLIGTDGSIGNDLNKTKNFTLGDLRNYVRSGELKYKVFTALLTQSGTSSLQPLYQTNLTIGTTYQIIDDGGGANHDFTNVGAPSNAFGTYFVATGEVPSSWGINVYLRYDTGSPTVKVLENTIGNVWWIYNNVGDYVLNSNNLFTIGKTIVFIGPENYNITESPQIAQLTVYGEEQFVDYIEFLLCDKNGRTNGLVNKSIEIRVYN